MAESTPTPTLLTVERLADIAAEHTPENGCTDAGCQYRWLLAHIRAQDARIAALVALDAVLDFSVPVAVDVRLGIPVMQFDGVEDVNAAFALAAAALTQGAAVAALEGTHDEKVEDHKAEKWRRAWSALYASDAEQRARAGRAEQRAALWKRAAKRWRGYWYAKDGALVAAFQTVNNQIARKQRAEQQARDLEQAVAVLAPAARRLWRLRDAETPTDVRALATAWLDLGDALYDPAVRRVLGEGEA